MTWFW